MHQPASTIILRPLSANCSIITKLFRNVRETGCSVAGLDYRERVYEAEMSEIGKSAMREKLENCRERITDMISHYLREDKGKGKVGALKFLKDLYICDVAVSSRSRKGYPAFMEYVNKQFLTVDEEVLSYFDHKKNMDAFLHWEKRLTYQKVYDKSFGSPPFLLMQKARTVKDRAMVRYLALANFDEASGGEEADEAARQEKADAYLEWLQSIAFFEICVREYTIEVDRYDIFTEEGTSQKTAEFEELAKRIKTIDKVVHTMDEESIQKWEQETRQMFTTWLNSFHKLYFESFFLAYCLELFLDLFTSLRVLVLIEYVNVNTTVRKGTDDERITLRNSGYRSAYEEALFWEKTVDRWLQNEKGVRFAHNCFAMMETWNRNHADHYKMLNRVAERILPLNNTRTEKLESLASFQDALKEYISIMENRYADCMHESKKSPKQREQTNEEAEQEKDRLLEIWMQLAKPVWIEMNEGSL